MLTLTLTPVYTGRDASGGRCRLMVLFAFNATLVSGVKYAATRNAVVFLQCCHIEHIVKNKP